MQKRPSKAQNVSSSQHRPCSADFSTGRFLTYPTAIAQDKTAVAADDDFSGHTHPRFGGAFPPQDNARATKQRLEGDAYQSDGSAGGPERAGLPVRVLTISEGGSVAEHDHHEADELDFAAGDFWVQIESSHGNGHIWDRNLNLSTSGNVANGTILTTLLFAYIGYHARLLDNHQCSHPDCRLVGVHRQLAWYA